MIKANLISVSDIPPRQCRPGGKQVSAHIDVLRQMEGLTPTTALRIELPDPQTAKQMERAIRWHAQNHLRKVVGVHWDRETNVIYVRLMEKK